MQPTPDPRPSDYRPSSGWEDYQAGHLAAQTRLLGDIAQSTDTIKNILIGFVVLFVLGVVITVALLS